jgi:hypothetical protein
VSIARTVAPMSDSFMMHVRFLSPGEGRPSIDGIRQGKLCDTAFGETISDGSSPASRSRRDALSADRGHGPFVAESGRFGSSNPSRLPDCYTPRQAGMDGICRAYTERTWVFRKAGCVPRASGQDAPTRRSGHYGEEAQRRPGVRGACNAAKNPRALGIDPSCRDPIAARSGCSTTTRGVSR